MKVDKKPLKYGVFGGLIASLCCITPLVLIFFGLAGVSTALAVTKYSPYFLGGAVSFTAAGLFFHYRTKKCSTVQEKRKRTIHIIATFILMIGLYVIINYWLLELIAPFVYR